MVKKITVITLCLFFFIKQAAAQCAMCKAVVEANLESGGTAGAGLNDGILYLMAMPYILILLFCVFWYFQNKKPKPVN
jgi:preprotein translocase subunit SecY